MAEQTEKILPLRLNYQPGKMGDSDSTLGYKVVVIICIADQFGTTACTIEAHYQLK